MALQDLANGTENAVVPMAVESGKETLGPSLIYGSTQDPKKKVAITLSPLFGSMLVLQHSCSIDRKEHLLAVLGR